MNWDHFEGSWHQVKGALREQWGRLTDDDVEEIDGSTERLIGTLQKRYGIVREDAERSIRSWLASVGPEPSEA